MNAATAAPVCATFAVSDVVPATEPLEEVPYRWAVEDFLGTPVESCSRYRGTLVRHVLSHPLVATLHAGFTTHRPVVLSPDAVWLTLCQGVAHHVNAHAETLRGRLVAHAGRLDLVVERPDFVKGSPENPWPDVFGELSAAVRAHTGPVVDLFAPDFSTTGPAERAACAVVLLDAVQSYFSYEVHSLCGIPAVTLEGTAADWRRVADRAAEFRQLELGWWADALRPVLDQFVAAAEGAVDRPFWESMYKWRGPDGSGSPHVSGWVVTLFPYLVNPAARRAHYRREPTSAPPVVRNPWLAEPPGRHGPGRDDFPKLPAKAPFLWKYHGTDYPMEFVGGLIGVGQDPRTLGLRPEIGWAVRAAGREGS